MRSGITRVHPVTFFAVTYGLSWLIWIPLVLSHFGIGPASIPEGISSVVRLFGVLMPATSALLLMARVGGRAAVRSLLRRLTIWRVGWIAWAAAIIVQPALLLFSGWAYNTFSGQPPVEVIALDSIAVLVVNILFLLLAALGEEIGWRGVALPALQQRRSALTSSVILAFLWGTWHLPFWLLLDIFDQYGFGYLALNYVFGFPLTLYITWLYNHGRSSLLLPVALHVVFNIVNVAWLPVTSNVGAFGFVIVMEWILALLVLPHLEAESFQATKPIPA